MDREAFDQRLASLRETRARLPELVRNRHASRHRRTVMGHDGRLLLIEADAPAAANLAAGADPRGLADRGELLFRLVTALRHPGVDGVIASADVIDDLLLLEVLEDRLAIGAMNHAGLAGSVLSPGSRFTGYDVDTVVVGHLDGGRIAVLIDPLDPSTADTLETCGRTVTALAAGGVLALVAPSWCRPSRDGLVPDHSTDALIRAVDVASGVGGRSQFTWLLVPPVDGLEQVMAATTLPGLLAVGESGADDPRLPGLLRVPGVRGMVVPGAMLYPPDGDVATVIDRAAALVHAPAE
jgi:Cgl0159-like